MRVSDFEKRGWGQRLAIVVALACKVGLIFLIFR